MLVKRTGRDDQATFPPELVALRRQGTGPTDLLICPEFGPWISGDQAVPQRLEQIPEKLMALLWKERAAREAGFRAEDGQRFRVLYPGRSSTSAGPDFRGAALEKETELGWSPEMWSCTWTRRTGMLMGMGQTHPTMV